MILEFSFETSFGPITAVSSEDRDAADSSASSAPGFGVESE